MKKRILPLVAMMMAVTGTAHAAWNVEASATGTATVAAESHWSIAQKNAGVFKEDGSVTTPLTMTISNAAAGTEGRFALSSTAMDKDNWWVMTNKADATKTFRLQAEDTSVITWDSTHNNYKSNAPVAAGGQIDVNFKPKPGEVIAAGAYEIVINLQSETV